MLTSRNPISNGWPQSSRFRALVFLLSLAFAACLWLVGTPLPVHSQDQSAAPPPVTTSSVQAFQTDLFTGAATAEIPILVPPGTAGVAPKITLRYNSGVVDELDTDRQGQGTGLGWTLDIGGMVVRDPKNSTDINNAVLKLVFGNVSHDLVLVDSVQKIYHTKDETFWRMQYFQQGDYWILTTKDGTQHRFGFNTDSKATALIGSNLSTPVTYKYLLDEVKTTSGTSIRYSYVKQTATASLSGMTYDQAVYPNVITYAYHGGVLVGLAREVRFFRAARQDWTDTSPSTFLSFHERDRIDSIEVRVGGSLVRKYLLGFDYSIDRNPSHTWGGGATGDLTLKTVRMFGTNGTSSLPALTFTYTGPVLASATNGIGGMVSYTYEKLTSLYSVCVSYNFGDADRCVDWGPSTTPESVGTEPSLLGAILTTNSVGTTPLYSVCVNYNFGDNEGCRDWAPSNNPASAGDTTAALLGYALTTNLLGTVPIYSVCVTYNFGDADRCVDWGPSTSPQSQGTEPSLLGYIYAGQLDRPRHRVLSRTLSDGLGWTSTTDFAYSTPATSSDGKEFRGHASVRSYDPFDNYTDTFFHQDDAKRGRPSQIEIRSSTGALFNKVVNTWATTNPFTGVTFVFLSRVDKHKCDGQATCLQTAQTFTYDSNGNSTGTFNLGNVGLTGDERDERTDWTVNTTSWIHRPSRVTLINPAGALVRERWLSYDTLGRLTREESRLAGAQGNAGNPVVTNAYDVYGNKTSTTNPRGCATSTTFDSSKTYPATVTSCLNHVTSYQYDARFGVVTSQTDPNSQTTTSTYDIFGRLTRVRGPLDGTSTYGTVSHFYLDWGNPSLQRIQTFRTEQHGTGNVIWSEEFFDGLGRVDKTRSEGPGGQTIETDVNYDARGQVSAQSAPRFSTETPVWTQFTYDVLGRQTRITHPDGTFATSSYSPGLVTLTDERGNVRRRYLDAYDRLIKVEEINGRCSKSAYTRHR